MNYINNTVLNNIILKKLNIIPCDFDLIVGVPWSCMLAGNLMSFYLNKPYTDIHSFLNGHIYKACASSQLFDISEFKKISATDDSIAAGSAAPGCANMYVYTMYLSIADKLDLEFLDQETKKKLNLQQSKLVA